jgi:hypothetical protein
MNTRELFSHLNGGSCLQMKTPASALGKEIRNCLGFGAKEAGWGK